MKHPLQRKLEQACYAGAARVTKSLLVHLPLRWAWRIADQWALTTLRAAPKRRAMAEANVAATFPTMTTADCRRVVRRSVSCAARTMLELLMLPRLSKEDLARMIETPDLTPLREAAASGCGLIMITAHYGNWEFLAAHFAHQVAPLTVIARDAAHEGTADLINSSRQSHGLKILGRRDTREMLRLLNRGGCLGMLPDQHAAVGGIRVDFMGRPAWTFTGPALLASRTGARVFASFCSRDEDDRLRMVVLPEIVMARSGDREADLIANTQLINQAIEQAIRAHPDNWLWLHNRWKEPKNRPVTETVAETTD